MISLNIHRANGLILTDMTTCSTIDVTTIEGDSISIFVNPKFVDELRPHVEAINFILSRVPDPVKGAHTNDFDDGNITE